MTVASTEGSWQVRAACRGRTSVLFFPPARELAEQRLRREAAAKRICSHCPVGRDCLEYALRMREAFGIWGGLNEDERRDVSASAVS